MKAVQFAEPGRIALIETPEPSEPGQGEVLMRVHRVGVCGTDLAGYLGKMPFFSYPRIPGHELGVEVIKTGPGVTHLQPGDRCAIEPYMNCQKCSSCRRGHTNCCEENQTLGVHCDGGLRPFFILPARKLHPSKKLGYDQLALVETLAIGAHAIHRAAPQPEESVLIIGAGPIGLSALEFAKLTGAQVIVMDINERRLAFCRERMGVEYTLPFRGEGGEVESLKELTNGSMPHVVVDATGNHKSMSNALNYSAFAGRVVYVGITTQEIEFPHPLMHRKEITLMASRNAIPAEFKRIIRLIEDGKIDTKPWITHHALFGNLPDVFETFTKPETGVIKAIVKID